MPGDSHGLPTVGQPVRKAIRRLRWFKDSFRRQIEHTSAETGIMFDVDEQILAGVFVEWLRAFEAQKPSDPANRRAYVGFAAGLMLKTLIARKPLSVSLLPDNADPAEPAFFWPEGYLYVAFCLNIRSAVLAQDFREELHAAPELHELRTWWSFRENAEGDPALGIAFLDLFAGEEPCWSMPGVFSAREIENLVSGPGPAPSPLEEA